MLLNVGENGDEKEKKKRGKEKNQGFEDIMTGFRKSVIIYF